MSTEPYQEWCVRLQRSDRDAFESVFRALHDALFRYALYITVDDSAARDIVQESFVRLWERRDTLDGERSLKALLFRMVRNSSYNYQRDSRRREQLLLDAPDHLTNGRSETPDSLMNARGLDEKLKRWIEALPERQREALVLSRYEGLTHVEVAQVMGISARTVNNHLVRALETLRDRIRAYEPDLLAP